MPEQAGRPGDAAGAGPLYDQTDAGRRAAEEPVEVPDDASEEAAGGTPTGEKQAEINREDDPPT